jgi:hypothetical protein
VTFEFALRPEVIDALTKQQSHVPDNATQPNETTQADQATAASQPAIPSNLPFQLRITYTKPNGMKCMRVATQNKPVTADRSQAEQVSLDTCPVPSSGVPLSCCRNTTKRSPSYVLSTECQGRYMRHQCCQKRCPFCSSVSLCVSPPFAAIFSFVMQSFECVTYQHVVDMHAA